MFKHCLIVFLVSMVPIIELRGAIPYGVGFGLPLWLTYICLEKGKKGGEKLQAKAGRGLFWALLLFVGIPLPGTGAWTGTLAASLLDMDFRRSVLACMGGVLLAGCIMGALSLRGVSAFGAIAG